MMVGGVFQRVPYHPLSSFLSFNKVDSLTSYYLDWPCDSPIIIVVSFNGYRQVFDNSQQHYHAVIGSSIQLVVGRIGWDAFRVSVGSLTLFALDTWKCGRMIPIHLYCGAWLTTSLGELCVTSRFLYISYMIFNHQARKKLNSFVLVYPERGARRSIICIRSSTQLYSHLAPRTFCGGPSALNDSCGVRRGQNLAPSSRVISARMCRRNSCPVYGPVTRLHRDWTPPRLYCLNFINLTLRFFKEVAFLILYIHYNSILTF